MEKTITVKAKNGEESVVYFLPSLKELNEKLLASDNSLIVYDTNTENILECRVEPHLTLEAGEKHKNFESIHKILEKGLEEGLSRDSTFIGFGGGVILDMTAFASSIYMRGSRLVLVPTTLLSMVDATLGGKTGIDYYGLKNFIGTFYPSQSIYISTEVLKSLNDKEFLNGMGEVVKHALLTKDESLYAYLVKNRDKILSRESDTLNEMVYLSLMVKKEFIERDPEEKKGIRSFLNLGHTFSHAYESITDYEISHGEGVIWGTVKALEVGVLRGETDEKFYEKAISLIKLYPFRINDKIPEDRIDDFLDRVKNDKKKRNKKVNFVLLKNQGEPFLTPLEEKEIVRVITN